MALGQVLMAQHIVKDTLELTRDAKLYVIGGVELQETSALRNDDIGRPPVRRRLPVVLYPSEVASVLAHLETEDALLARLLYGTACVLLRGINFA